MSDNISAPCLPQFDGDLLPYEYFWRNHQQWLEKCGYLLPPRYKPDWIPSWKGTDLPWDMCDDGQAPNVRRRCLCRDGD